jgi:hypothetical protein
MVPAMLDILRRNAFCPRIVLVPDSLAIDAVIEDILLLEFCATDVDWNQGVLYLLLV